MRQWCNALLAWVEWHHFHTVTSHSHTDSLLPLARLCLQFHQLSSTSLTDGPRFWGFSQVSVWNISRYLKQCHSSTFICQVWHIVLPWHHPDFLYMHDNHVNFLSPRLQHAWSVSDIATTKLFSMHNANIWSSVLYGVFLVMHETVYYTSHLDYIIMALR